MSDRKDLPAPTAPNFNQRLRETIQTYLGRQGDPLDRGLTLRDLIDAGVVKFKKGFSAASASNGGSLALDPVSTGTGSGTAAEVEPDLTPPPQPDGFAVTAAISHVFIEHNAPIYTQGGGHLRTHVFGVIVETGDPLPTFSAAVEVGQFTGNVWAMPSNPSTTWRLWIKWETNDGVLSPTPAGGTNGLQAVTGQDVALLLKALTGEITESQLFADLGARIDLVDGAGPGSVSQRIAAEAVERASEIQELGNTTAQDLLNEATARANADGALQTQINMLSAASSGDFQDLIAALQEEQTARIDGDAAETTARQTLAAQMRGGYTGTDITDVTTGLLFSERQARAGGDAALAQDISTLSSTVQTNKTSAEAAITSEAATRASADSANASQINSLSSSLNTTNTNVTTAQTAANNAATLAGSKGKVLVQAATPGAADQLTQNLWIDTTGGANTPKRWTGTAWAAVTDKVATDAAAAAAAAQATANNKADASALTTTNTNVTNLNNTVTAQAGQITTLTSSVNSNTSAISTEATTRASQTGELFAKYTVKVDTNGYVSGFGLASTENNATPFSNFAIRADRFYIASPSGPDVAPAMPFIVRTTATTIGGVSVPVGVYMSDAFIQNGTITNAKIANLAVDNAKIANLSADKLTAGSIAVGQHIQSSNYEAGTAGWRINGNGTAEFSGVTVRGTVIATAGNIGGITIAQNAVRAGQTDFNTAAGFFLGSDGKLSLGNAGGNRLTWDGSNLNIFSPGLTLNNGSAAFSGSLDVKSAASGARLEIKNNVIKVFDANNVLRVQIGDLLA